MDLFLEAFIFFIIVMATANVYHLVYKVRKDISCATAMMAAMIMGSMAGLLVGTILALNLSFSFNTLLAMIIGIGAGVMIGLPFNAMAVLDGLMAGAMGGMMGAMLGEMLNPQFIIIVSIFLLAILLLSVILLRKAVKQELGTGIIESTSFSGERIKKLSILTVCVTVFLCSIVMIGSFYGTQTSAVNLENSKAPSNHEHHHPSD